MPGERPLNPRLGDRAEYLGTFLMSRIAQAVPVPRQEDYGIDYLGALLRPDGQAMLIGRRFAIQWKSNVASLREPFGAHRKGRWRPRECLWLLGREPFPVDTTPFFLGHVDVARGRVKLYATSLMWHARWRGFPTEVEFVPEVWPRDDATFPPVDPISMQPIGSVYPEGHPPSPPGLGQRAVVPLGYPIVELDMQMVAERDPSAHLDAVRETLNAWCRVEELNRLAASLNVPVCFWHWSWMTNEPPDQRDLRTASYAHPVPEQGLPASDIERALWPFIDAFNHVVESQAAPADSLRLAMSAVVDELRARRFTAELQARLDPAERAVALHALRQRCEQTHVPPLAEPPPGPAGEDEEP